MAKKQDRYKKLPPLKRKNPTGKISSKATGGKWAKLSDEDIAEGVAASEKLAKRPTSDFSTEELGALMQVPPGGAEQHQIRTRGRQFNRVVNDMPEVGAIDAMTNRGTVRGKKPMSSSTPKLEPED